MRGLGQRRAFQETFKLHHIHPAALRIEGDQLFALFHQQIANQLAQVAQRLAQIGFHRRRGIFPQEMGQVVATVRARRNGEVDQQRAHFDGDKAGQRLSLVADLG